MNLILKISNNPCSLRSAKGAQLGPLLQEPITIVIRDPQSCSIGYRTCAPMRRKKAGLKDSCRFLGVSLRNSAKASKQLSIKIHCAIDY